LAEKRFNIAVPFSKYREEERQAFGWASVTEEGGRLVVDHHGDIIKSITMEKAAYAFVRDVRAGGEMHLRKGHHVASLIESMFFSKEKQELLGIDLAKVGWWTGWAIHDEEVWLKVKSGEYPALSIGGTAVVVDA
jgi:hypothetical protein